MIHGNKLSSAKARRLYKRSKEMTRKAERQKEKGSLRGVASCRESRTQTGKNVFLYCYKLARLYRLYTTVKQLFFSRLDGFSLDYAKGLF
jgi:hypothetical protein